MKTRLLIIIGIMLSSLLGYVEYTNAENCIIVDRNSPCVDSKYLQSFDTDPNFTLAELSWKEASFTLKNGTGFATVILKDYDSNRYENYKETVNVFVHSDSDRELHIIELQETENNSGMFERTFGISDTRSAPNVVFTSIGDTITVMYVDTTMPPGYFASDKNLVSHAIIDSIGSPLERAPASFLRITDSFENSIHDPAVGEQVHIVAEVANGLDHEQKFAYLVLIQDENEKSVALGWIDGVLNAGDSFSPSFSWIPIKEGKHHVTVFVWESVENPSALSPPISMEFTVIPEDAWYSRYSGTDNYDETLCSGTQLCLTEKILRIVDGDTIYLSGGYEVRLSLVNTPERHQIGFYDASKFTAELCPVTSTVMVDQDDKQPYDAYDRLLGKVTCHNKVLNAELLYAGHADILTQYCSTSEFSDESWAQEFGC